MVYHEIIINQIRSALNTFKGTHTNMLKSIFLGIKYFINGIPLCFKPELRPYVFLPLLINIIVTSIGLYFAVTGAVNLSDYIVNEYLPSYLSLLKWLVALIFWILIFLFTIYTFTTITLLIGSPFYSTLSEKAQEILSNTPAVPTTLKDTLIDMPHSIGLEIRKFIYRIPIIIVSIICLFIPVIGPVIIALLNSWGCAMDYTSYSFENNKISFKNTLSALKENKALCISFGFCVWICMLIPFFNIIIVPVAICGGTQLWHDKLKLTCHSSNTN